MTFALDAITLATWVTAGATVVLAIITAISIIYLNKAERHAHEADARAEQQRYDLQRPLLVPIGGLPFVDTERCTVDWSARDVKLVVQSVGAGVALNAAALLLGPTEPTLSNRWYARSPLPIPADDASHTIAMDRGGSMISNNATIDGCALCAPDKPAAGAMLNQGATWVLLRLTLTYRDVFGRKHAAIFDYTSMARWQMVAIQDGIEADLPDLDERAPRTALRTAPGEDLLNEL